MEQNLQELYDWIDNHFINRQKKNLTRDFSDAVPLAEILKEHYPKLVDLHNYGPKNAIVKKIENWFTLNHKVLSKLDLQITPTDMENIAKCVPGAIEKLLFRVKAKFDAQSKDEENEKVAGGDYSKTDKPKKISAELFQQKVEELEIKTQAVEILNKKISHMQALIEIKDQRISELQAKLDEYISSEKSSGGFFEKFLR
ncbi:uncharacterized protein CBL_06732 [Carabus blaptoides fortunei]